MTAQVNDTFELDGLSYAITAAHGGPLFEPRDYGLEPVPPDTSNLRGFCCAYGLEGEQIVLRSLAISLSHSPDETVALDTLPRLAERAPQATEHRYWFYADVDMSVPFSGVFLLGSGFINALYVHMGFHSPWKYRRVLELEAEAGRVRKVTDVSATFRAIRRELIARSLAPEPPAFQLGLASWVESSYARIPNVEHWANEPVPRNPVMQAAILASPGPNRLATMSQLRRLLSLSPAQAKAMLDAERPELLRGEEKDVRAAAWALREVGAQVEVIDLEKRVPIYVDPED